jgi:sugar/nucleoside kinase (ribokinase family)
MLTVVGDLVADLIVLGSARLERGTDNTAEVRLTRGGSAANVAVAAASRHPVRFIGRVGDDTLGETLVRQLEKSGVEVRVQRAGRTGAIVILVDDDGERTMITDRGASAELDTIDDDWWADSDWVHLPLYGFAAPTTREALLAVCTRLAGRGILISVDLSSTATMRDLGSELLMEILDSIGPSVTFANSDEAELADEWMLRPSGVFVVKRGGESVHVRQGGTVTEVAVERVDDVLDSTGAGDAFAAGYLVAVLGGADSTAAAEAGSALAMHALRRAGAI